MDPKDEREDANEEPQPEAEQPEEAQPEADAEAEEPEAAGEPQPETDADADADADLDPDADLDAEPAPKNSKARIAAIVAIIAIAAIAIVAAFVISGGSGSADATEVDVTQGVSAEFSGVDGAGEAKISGAYSYLDDQAADILADAYGDDQDAIDEALDLLKSAVSYELETSDGLSNGDTVTIAVSIDDSEIGDLPVTLVGSDIEVEVSGLADSDTQEIDLFEDLSIEYEGIAPYATATITADSIADLPFDVEFTCDPSTGFTPGDDILITADYDEQAALDAGYTVADDSASITVDGVASYYLFLEDIPDAAFDEMREQAVEIMEEEEGGWEGGGDFSAEYLGSYLFTANDYDADSGSAANAIVLVFEVSVTGADCDDFSYYEGVSYNQLIQLEDGESYDLNLDNGMAATGTYYPDDSSLGYVVGYESLDELLAAYTDQTGDAYDYETDIE